MDKRGQNNLSTGSQYGGFFVFLNLYRWLNWVLAVLLLLLGAVPKMPAWETALVFGSAFFYNSLLTLWPARIERKLKKRPLLILIDVVFCASLMIAYGWRSPFTIYSFSPVMLTGYLFGIRGAFIAAGLSALGYGLSVAINGYTWAEIERMEAVDSHLFQYFYYFLIAIFFSYPAVLAEKLRKTNEELVAAQETIERLALAKERRRLAGDMHDSVTQGMLSGVLILDAAIKETGRNAKLKENLIMAKETISSAYEKMNMVIDDLFDTSLASQSLTELLEHAIAEARRLNDLEISCDLCAVNPEPPPEIKKTLYLSTQEALQNIVKHSGAFRVTISLRVNREGYILTIVDDGTGFVGPVKTNGLGLRTISARAAAAGGFVEIKSDNNNGTALMITIPGDAGMPEQLESMGAEQV